jgi:hypothetical protein
VGERGIERTGNTYVFSSDGSLVPAMGGGEEGVEEMEGQDPRAKKVESFMVDWGG